jgi:hypothetical protein
MEERGEGDRLRQAVGPKDPPGPANRGQGLPFIDPQYRAPSDILTGKATQHLGRAAPRQQKARQTHEDSGSNTYPPGGMLVTHRAGSIT